MTDKEKIETLKKCFNDTIWMAIRYAHGKKTYAPGIVRDAVYKFKTIFPDWKIKPDITITPPDKENTLNKGDYLDDLFKNDDC